ncbi:hypothetical protein HYV49_03520 [Candidatus Pacearchaeota archaeon]|nr:hypothetical protein [Candidatus Pacearchaeota archaeon]
MQKKKVTLSLDDQIYSEFQKYCEENAIMLSKKIELFMKDILKNNNKELGFKSRIKRGKKEENE